ncbi:MAG: hypothetical protein EOO74_06775, partial [Myxococcales bacterium]
MPDTDAREAPPLSRWDHAWRIALVLLVSGVSVWQLWPAQLSESVWLFAADVVLGLVAFVLMFFRRRWPLQVTLATTVLGLGSAAAAGPSLLAYVSLTTHRKWRQIVPLALLGVLVGQVFY